MHNLIALSLALPGTALHGQDDCETGSRSTAPAIPRPRSFRPPRDHRRAAAAARTTNGRRSRRRPWLKAPAARA